MSVRSDHRAASTISNAFSNRDPDASGIPGPVNPRQRTEVLDLDAGSLVLEVLLADLR
jgi:hypothetical protein